MSREEVKEKLTGRHMMQTAGEKLLRSAGGEGKSTSTSLTSTRPLLKWALMSAVCEPVISVCGVPKVNCPQMLGRSGLLKTFLTDQHKQLEALDALQELTDTIEHSHNLMWIFLDILWDEDIFSETIFFKWEHHRSTKGGIGSSGQFFSRIRRVMEKVLGTHVWIFNDTEPRLMLICLVCFV